MTHFAKELATDLLLMTAAIIGATWLLAALGAFNHAAPTVQYGTTTHATTHIVACDHYLSHEAMVLNQVDYVGPAAAPFFCVVPATEG